MRGMPAEVDLVVSEETAVAINDLLFPPPRVLSRVPGRKRRIMRKPLEHPDRQPLDKDGLGG